MAISFYEASVDTYLQIMPAISGVLDKGLAHAKETDIDPKEIVETRLAPDMLPFRFQIHSVVHHSKGAIEGMKTGKFGPPSNLPEHDYAGLQSYLAEAISSLKAMSEAEVNALENNEVIFEIRGMKMPFTAKGFLFSFSLPNFYFHASTAYDILRHKGTKIGKRDFMGAMNMKS